MAGSRRGTHAWHDDRMADVRHRTAPR
jgi:hypothetical protein